MLSLRSSACRLSHRRSMLLACVCRRTVWSAACCSCCYRLAMPSSAVAMASSTIISCLRYSTHSCVYRRSVWCAAHCSRCCRWLCHRRLSRRPRRGSHQLTSLLASLACVPPLYVTRRSLLSLLSSAMPSSAVVSASPSFLSAVVVARLARVLAAALLGVPLAALAAVVG